MVERVRVRLGTRKPDEYEIIIGTGTLSALGSTLSPALSPETRRIALISNRKVFRLYGEQASSSLSEAGFAVKTWLMPDGEQHKNLRTLGRALGFLSDAGVERSDAIVALGGGVVGDLAGLAAALYMRGLAFMQVPTTLLAQIDASVGGKTGVNLPAGKNLAGAFLQPSAVLIDTATLGSLPRRELTAGWCEAVKQGAAGSLPLFNQTCRFLRSLEDEKPSSRAVELNKLIAAQCAFKARIVAGDEREEVSRSDSRSRRILNLGHTVAHALEAVTAYRRFRHGEAVGYGLIVAAEISAGLGLLDVSELESLRAAVSLCGRLPRASDLDSEAISKALVRDKKSVGGQIRWVLLERIGRAAIVDGREITPKLLRSSLRAGLHHTI